jgi:AGCS family alanine or glycine:cation symporter
MWLVIGASVFTIYFAFVQFRFFDAISLVKGDYSDQRCRRSLPLSGLATALSGTVGLGNIAGVAVAVGIGGQVRRSG